MTSTQVQTLDGQFNQAQLEMLKVVARPVSDEDLRAIKKLIVKYFVEKIRNRADEVWDNNNWSDEQLLSMHLRVKDLRYRA
jgi:hypothetical protein